MRCNVGVQGVDIFRAFWLNGGRSCFRMVGMPCRVWIKCG